jgi:type IV secretory pathway protease TraF
MKRFVYHLVIFLIAINGFVIAQNKLVKPKVKLNVNWAKYLALVYWHWLDCWARFLLDVLFPQQKNSSWLP